MGIREGEKIRLVSNEMTPGLRADKGTECRVWSRTAYKRRILHDTNLGVPPLGPRVGGTLVRKK